MALVDCVDPDNRNDLFEALTERVEDGDLRFPSAVVKDLKVRARFEQVTSWVTGLGPTLRRYTAEVAEISWLMRQLQLELGYSHGVSDMDGKEPSIIAVASYARSLEEENVDFVMATEDLGSIPLRPTMEELCHTFSWERCTGSELLDGLDLGDLRQIGDFTR